jgi:hypothetical protein
MNNQISSKLDWKTAFFILLLVTNTIFHIFALFREPEAQTVAIGYFTCAATTLLCWLGRSHLQRLMHPELPGEGKRFLLLGSLGAAWVETAF